jgi:hypothetical protein
MSSHPWEPYRLLSVEIARSVIRADEDVHRRAVGNLDQADALLSAG